MRWRRARIVGSAAGRIAIVLALLAVLPLTACSPLRGIEAARVLADLSDAEAGRGTEESVVPTEVAFAPDSGVTAGDLYWPDRADATLALVPGVVPEGKDDPRLVALAQTLTHAGFAVLVPDIVNLRAQRVSPDDARAIASAIAYLANCGPRGLPSVGVMAISYAAGPAFLAALRPETASQLRFLVAIGGYHDLEAVVTFFTTGFFRTAPDQPWQHRAPNAYGKWVFVAANAERLAEPDDRAALAEMAARKLRDLDAGIADLRSGLGPQGRAVLALLDNGDPDRAAALIAGLPPAVRGDLAALDLARRDLSQLQVQTLLVHGRDDPIIPSTESQALARAAPAGTATLYLVDSLAHVELSPAGLVDGLKLWRAITWLLAQRDAAPAPNLAACRGTGAAR
jgi:pimeloyl-ACP methyl ester carboxylesterase